jgi:hypothetical protein
LTANERRILLAAQQNFALPQTGFDLKRGAYYSETQNNGIKLSTDVALNWEMLFSNAFFPSQADFRWGADVRVNGTVQGDMGNNFSYGFTIAGGIADRNAGAEPLAFFPYTFLRHWDGFVLNTASDQSDSRALPEGLCVGYAALPELSGSLLGGRMSYRWGRVLREWGGMSNGTSLTLNKNAQPFLALELSAAPLDWLIFSTLTGVLEQYPTEDSDSASVTNQNAFSITMMEINYKNIVHLDFGSSVVWAKRFELGYMFPLQDNFLHQINIAGLDNTSFFANLQGQYPGVAKLWVSGFWDELNSDLGIFDADKTIFAVQAGTTVLMPHISFGSLTLIYTKVKPYCYTSYTNAAAYVNAGESLGYYVPPGSDEALLRVDAMPDTDTKTHIQYQLIRHGAEGGSREVAGSSLRPPLGTHPQNGDAYQWQHVFKLGAEHTIPQLKIPVQLVGDFGAVYSYFTESPYSILDTSEYPTSLRIITTIGIKLYP